MIVAPSVPPRGFVSHVFERQVEIDRAFEPLWAWLNDPKTFTEQPWPYRVEFVTNPDGTSGFSPGVFNSHHGPLLNFSGVIGQVRPGYRDLHYCYGSYAVSLRLIRPTRLQFWAEPIDEDRTRVRLRVDSVVSPVATGLWTWAQRVFWRQFLSNMPRWVDHATRVSGCQQRQPDHPGRDPLR